MAGLLGPEWLVEIEADAVIPDQAPPPPNVCGRPGARGQGRRLAPEAPPEVHFFGWLEGGTWPFIRR